MPMRNDNIDLEYEACGWPGGTGASEWMDAAGLDLRIEAHPGLAEDWPADDPPA